jgi:hypothetical protein
MILKNTLSIFLIHLIICCNSFLSFGQLSFEWFNKDNGNLERINFQNGNYELLRINKDNNFKIQRKLRFEGVKVEDILPNYEVNLFPKGKNRILTVPGTGQVYELDLNNSLFRRIDKTFYRGYNFKALQFIQNDTLFSLGGTGFWQYHNVLSFFDPATSEWQVMYPKGNKPEGIYLNSSGISEGKVFAIEKLRDLDNKDPERKAQIFEFDIKSKKWSKFGELNISLLSENDINTPEFQWSSNHLFFLHAKEPIFADVLTNKVYKYNESRRSILTNKGKIYISNGWVYTFVNEHNKFKLDSIPYAELQRNSILLGTLYSKSTKTFTSNEIYIFGLVFILIIGSTIILIRLLKSKGEKSDKSRPEIPKYFDKLLLEYKSKGPDHLITTEELSRIIECDSMAFDTQRQYRSKFISSFNTYAFDIFGVADAIFRINHDSDKRFIHYGIKKELFVQIDNILL